MLILNLKNYPQSAGVGNIDAYLEAVSKFRGQNPDSVVDVRVAPAVYDMSYAATKITPQFLIGQHVDTARMGPSTGWVPTNALLEMGVRYTLVNHSEHRIWGDEIVPKLLEIQDAGMQVIVCCENLEEAEFLLDAHPYAIAYEDPELIGSGKSITSMQPEKVHAFVDLVQNHSIPFIGAGISSSADIRAGMAAGARGFIVASAFAKAQNPDEALTELVSAWERRD